MTWNTCSLFSVVVHVRYTSMIWVKKNLEALLDIYTYTPNGGVRIDACINVI